MSITRFSVLNDERKIIMGIDKANVFEPGVVYEAVKTPLDTIVLRPIGPYSIGFCERTEDQEVCLANETGEIMRYGYHLITKDEWNSIINKRLNRKDQ